MSRLKNIIHQYLSDIDVALYALEEQCADMSGWMFRKGYSKKEKVGKGKLSHTEYILTESGKNYIANEYENKFKELFKKSSNDSDSEFKLIKELRAYLKTNSDSYYEDKKHLNFSEKYALLHFERLM